LSAAYCLAAPGNALHAPYHDSEYGFPARDEAVLFERLILEINQAGLSWATILRKRVAFRAAFADFDVDRVAAFGPADVKRLMADAGITPVARLVRRMARRPSPACACGMGQALQENLSLHRRRDRQRVPDEPRLSARRA